MLLLLQGDIRRASYTRDACHGVLTIHYPTRHTTQHEIAVGRATSRVLGKHTARQPGGERALFYYSDEV